MDNSHQINNNSYKMTITAKQTTTNVKDINNTKSFTIEQKSMQHLLLWSQLFSRKFIRIIDFNRKRLCDLHLPLIEKMFEFYSKLIIQTIQMFSLFLYIKFKPKDVEVWQENKINIRNCAYESKMF